MLSNQVFKRCACVLAVCMMLLCTSKGAAMENETSNVMAVMNEVTHHDAGKGDERIHYVSIGTGPLIVFVHGFPDFWFSWRHQMRALSDSYRCVAMDLRGYNQSAKPKGQTQYDMPLLAGDVMRVIEDCGEDSAVVAGHDWGGAIAWAAAMQHPRKVNRLIILNLPHPMGLSRELAANPEQQKNSAYARLFQQEGAHMALTPEMLAGFSAPNDGPVREAYIAAFENSDFEAMLHYYKQNYPREPYTAIPEGALPQVTMPVLQFHGMDDDALLPGALDGTWRWIDASWTLVTVPGAGHWVQHDAHELVSQTMWDWLARTPTKK